MKKLYFLLFFAFSFLANAQIVNIPDANFKAKLLSASSSNNIASTQTPVCNSTTGWQWTVYSNYNIIDINGDGEIQVIEAQAIKWLDVKSTSIYDLTGIEAFVNLEYLNCSNNYLPSINYSQNVSLRYFNCNSNQLTSHLNVSSLTNLRHLTCIGNQLSSLDASNLTNLQFLYCSNNQLTSLDVLGCTALQSLSCYDNNLSSLDVSQNKVLTWFHCYNNLLESLNLKNGNTFFSWTNLDFSINPNIQYVCADDEDINLIQQYINDYGYGLTCHVNSYCSFVPGGIFYKILGNTKLDSNNNGCDISDINYPNLKFNITNGAIISSMISNQTGNYYIPVQAGNHTVTPNLEKPTYFNINPTSFVANFPTYSSPFTQNFCVTANGVKSDVEVMVMPINPARPGFDAYYKIVYRNKGNQIENGSVSLTFDDAVLDYLSSNPVYDSNAMNNFSWNYTNLQPFETREIEISFNVNSPMETPAVNNGDILNYLVIISTTNTDETPADNEFTLNQTVVGSYDPNDKTCLEGETLEISKVGDYVHYVIRFENTGTYPAENIVVKDMIDVAKFDVSTLVPLHGSHDFFTRIKDNKVEFIFENINLDFNDANNDGYVAFKIKTLPTLTLGQTFSNDANIYFDYNFPITTNEYLTTIDNVLNNQDFAFEKEFVLYPNPTRDILNISSKNQTEIQSVEIYNLIGQVVIAIPNSTNKIEVSSLETGTYFMKVNTEKGSSTAKFVKE